MPHQFWSPKKRAMAVVLCMEGYTYAEIAAKIGWGVGKSAVQKICFKFEQTGSVKDLPRSGRRKVTTCQDDRVMTTIVLKGRRMSSKDVANIMNDSGVKIAARTVRQHLFQASLKAKVPRKKPHLNAKQRCKRVKWAKEQAGWTGDQWGRVIFSDESKISLFGNDNKRFVRRRVGEENLPACTIPTMKHPVSVMIWGCMARAGVGRLKVLDGTVTARKYIDEVLEPKLARSAAYIFGPGSQ